MFGVGRFGRFLNRLLHPFGGGKPEPEPEPEPTGGGPGPRKPEPEPPPPGVPGWDIVATWDGPGTKAWYTGPTDLDRLSVGAQVIVRYTDPDTGFQVYRIVHGPFNGDEEQIWNLVRFTVMQVSPP